MKSGKFRHDVPQLKRPFLFLLLFSLLFASSGLEARRAKHAQKSCYEIMAAVQLGTIRAGRKPFLVFADGTRVPVARAFEKEGLLYSDIAPWFDKVDKERSAKLLMEALEKELAEGKPGPLLRWLERYPRYYRPPGTGMTRPAWGAMSPAQRVEWLLARENLFDVINIRGREDLFYDDLLDYDDLRPSAEAPKFVQVGDDLGSYEIRSYPGETDRRRYRQQRDVVERFLEGKVGHQHFIHQWPKNKRKRHEMAPRYLELLDAGTWFLFWRQMSRSPEEVDSVLTHPFLGVYTNPSLERLFEAILENDPKRFKNKYRMIGARALPGRPDVPGQKGVEWLPDFELRSGNKGIKRDFMEALLEARISSGDYSGLRDFREYRAKFDPSAPLEQLVKRWLAAEQIAILKQFEAKFPLLRWSAHKLSHNHLRNKVTAPLLDWAARVPMQYKTAVLERAQRRYAEGLVEIATEYLRRTESIRGPPEEAAARADAEESIKRLAFLFSSRVRLEDDFERYLTPRPAESLLPNLLVKTTGPLDVNKIHHGIEYSFRFPQPPRSEAVADEEIRASAEVFRRHMGGGEIRRLPGSGHGHDRGIRYQFTASNGDVWRFEWDGVRRAYERGTITRAWGGHLEVPSPKKAIQDARDIVRLYQAMRELGRDPLRSAGGAHFNVDLKPLFDLPPKIGARKLANLIAWFESRREMVGFLWQHPFRSRAALPFQRTESFSQRLNAFDGDWNALGRLLYEERYFNPYITRKPAYSQINATAIMGPIVPREYDRPLDLANPEAEWFPAFGGKGKDRIEFRLFDAPPDEYLAALQVKYMRAVLDRALNASGTIELSPVYAPDSAERWKASPRDFVRAAEAHLRELGLSPKEFAPLIADALRIQSAVPRPKEPLKKFEDLLPAR